MAGLTKKLPKNVAPRIFEGGRTTNLPHSAPELAQVLVRNLHKSCLTEIELAPTELKETMAQFSALVGAELAVCELAELLDEATDSNASFVEELAVADSVERINAQYSHLTEVIKFFTHDLTKTYPELAQLMHHARFLKQCGLLAIRSSAFMKNVLTVNDPLLSPALRLKHAAEDLVKAAQHCYDKSEQLWRLWHDAMGDDASAGVGRSGLDRKSIIGLLAIVQQNAAHGKIHLLMPSEAKRRKKVDKKLARRRMRGGGHSSEEEAEERRKVERAEAAFIQCTNCGNTFREDAVYCRKCGTARPTSPLGAQRAAVAKGPPPLKRADREESEVDEDEDFLTALRINDPDAGAYDVWGAKAFQPSTRQVAPQFLQKESVDDVSGDEKAGGESPVSPVVDGFGGLSK